MCKTNFKLKSYEFHVFLDCCVLYSIKSKYWIYSDKFDLLKILTGSFRFPVWCVLVILILKIKMSSERVFVTIWVIKYMWKKVHKIQLFFKIEHLKFRVSAFLHCQHSENFINLQFMLPNFWVKILKIWNFWIVQITKDCRIQKSRNKFWFNFEYFQATEN